MDIKNLTRKITQDNFATEQVDILQNNLLGFYDDNGEYCITPQILDELIKLPKTKKNTFHNSLFCVGNLLGFGEIAFELEYDKNTNDKDCAKATLYVLEEVDKINGYLQNTIKTKVGDFEETVENFIESSYEHFHVSLDTSTDISSDEGMERSILDDIEHQDSFILAKKQYTLQLEKLCNEKCLDAYGKYFTYRYSALTKMNNDFSQAVIELFEEEYARIEKLFLKDKNYKMLNELLDKCIEEISGTSENYIAQEKEYDEIIASALENFSDSIKALHKKLGNKALNLLGKQDKGKMEDILEAEDYHNKHNDPVEEKVEIIENQPAEMEEISESQQIEESYVEELKPAEEEMDNIVTDLFTTNPNVQNTATSEVIMPKGSESSTIEQQSPTTTQGATITQSYMENKIIDTNRTNSYDDSMLETADQEDAVSSLKSRVGRLSALTSKSEPDSITSEETSNPKEVVADEPKVQSNDEFVRNEVSSYLSEKVQAELPEEKKAEVKSKPRSFEQLFSYLNEQNKLKKDEIALRNQRNRVIHEQTQDNTLNPEGRDY